MILVQSEIKYVFNPYVLMPGDILLMNTYEERLRKKLECKYEHAAIYVGDAFIMEANGAYVNMSHIYSYAFRELDHACVLRLKKYSPINLDNIARNARKQMGREYVNTRQFIHVRNRKNSEERDTSNRSFCSRLVAQSYYEEGINVLPNPDYCEPDDFLISELLVEVKDAVIPINADLIKVVVSQQEQREKDEMDSPNAELFKQLSDLYNTDIQDLDQVIKSALNNPMLDDEAIEIIKASKMFKHMELVNDKMPWFMDNDTFFKYFSDVKAGLHFIYSQMNHYDHTILRYYKELHLQLIVGAYYCPQSKLLLFLRDYIKAMLEEAIICRKRLAQLFELILSNHKEESLQFIEKYGFYSEYESVK